jgi:hypothetical protein
VYPKYIYLAAMAIGNNITRCGWFQDIMIVKQIFVGSHLITIEGKEKIDTSPLFMKHEINNVPDPTQFSLYVDLDGDS